MDEKSLKYRMLKNYPNILGVNDVSQILCVNPKTVYKLLNEGVLLSIRVGRLYKIPKWNVVKLLNAD